ncbi:UDP-N-acetylmuramyl-tripeptide synthetase [Candidatus Parcubacteria bacterium]|nr:MAG: UDP-N-acetylmuramyl-tripeptide synthetase [Candidatus Parcubacteria bacterium]
MHSLISRLRARVPRRLWRMLASPYHRLWAWAGAAWYGMPSRRIAVIGVTGTNGKTTVVHLLHGILNKTGVPAASVSSLEFRIRDAVEQNKLKMTMPGRLHLQRFLARAVRAGCRVAIVEVTSEGIVQHRHRGIRFFGAVLTNVTPEHIEAHGSFAAYRAAKLKLFHAVSAEGFAVINADDPSAELFARAAAGRIIRYSQKEIAAPEARYPVRIGDVTPRHAQFSLGNAAIALPLGGAFNVTNALAAASAALALGIAPAAIAAALAQARPPAGRLTYIVEEPFAAVVDYAHTPDALERVYTALQGNAKPPAEPSPRAVGEARNSNLICVLGSAGGGRDRWKRAAMGKVAGRYCQEIILTSEDPDDEEPAAIADEILSGIPSDLRSRATIELDRRAAIRAALQRAKPGDTVVITGMGAQPWFMGRSGKIPWDEAKIVREEYAMLGKR